ncbi:MAG: hypothetical protein M1324_04390 [Patescibacteria group bacterium]|nr:hypothetical protein [Patescibacteria group bacterium]
MKTIQNILKLFLAVILTLLPKSASAHCPLCVAGAGILAVFATSIGVSTVVVGLFIGAFSLALGIWISRSIKKKYFKFQDALASIIIFISTVVPIMPLIEEYRPLYISFYGKYGTFLHNTYLINLYLLGTAIGAIILFISPYLSLLLTRIRGKKLPFQSMIITFGLLIIIGLFLQFIF